MTSLLISDIDEPLENRLRAQASAHGRTLEEEARTILQAALPDHRPKEDAPEENLADAIRSLFEPFGGVELDLDWMRKQPSTRKPPEFD